MKNATKTLNKTVRKIRLAILTRRGIMHDQYYKLLG